jgi:hypothetical protein
VDLDSSDTLVTHLHGTSQGQLWGLEANTHLRPWFFGCLRFDGLVGFRYVNLREKLTVVGDYRYTEPPAGGDPDETPDNPEDNHTNTMHTSDRIEVRNNFYGGQIGTSFECPLGDRLFVNGFFKLAIGGTEQRLIQEGSTLQDAATIETHAGGPFVPRPAAVFPGGLFTPAVEGGTASRTSHWSVMPDLNLNIGCRITPNVQAYAGYNYFRLSDVARLSSSSPLGVGPKQSYLEVHGLDVGLQIRY